MFSLFLRKPYSSLIIGPVLAILLPAPAFAATSAVIVQLGTRSRGFHGGHQAVAITQIQRGGRARNILPPGKAPRSGALGLRGTLDPAGETMRISAVSTELHNIQGIEYVGPIGVGTAPRPVYCNSLAEAPAASSVPLDARVDACTPKAQSRLNVVFDTGSTNLWMASDLCTTSPCNETGRNRYNHTLSETYNAQDSDSLLSVTFGTAELNGVKAMDNFQIGPCVVKNQTFGMIQEELGETFRDLPLEGIVGLGFPSLHASSDLPFFDNVIKQKVLAHNEFAFSMNSDGTSSILWGGVDPKLFLGQLRMFPVTQAHYWAIDLHEVKVGNTVVDMGAKAGRIPKLIFDSGTTFFATQGSILDQIKPSESAMECSNVGRLPSLVFKLKDAAGHFYELDLGGSEYTVPDPGTSTCTPALMEVAVPEKYGPAILVGETFMQNYFTVFDRGDGTDKDARVGFARAPHNPRGLAADTTSSGEKAIMRSQVLRRVNVASSGLLQDELGAHLAAVKPI